MRLRNAVGIEDGGRLETLCILRRQVAAEEEGENEGPSFDLDLEGRTLLPGLLNGHDHLDFSTFLPLGRPPYPNVYAWAKDVDAGAGDASVAAALAVPLVDRLFLGGLRNLLAGFTAVAHHNPFHRSMARDDFPVRVLAKYEYAHSPGLTPHLRGTYRTTDRRIPWMVHAGEGPDEASRRELARLTEENVLRQNTVIIHGIAFGAAEARLMATARAALVWCPESNRRLYGSTADVAALLAAGVKVGLGSDSPASGVRDPLSNLAAARREGVLSDAELLCMATVGTAAAARLPLGGLTPGSDADLVAVASREELLAGNRRAVALIVVRGRRLYGEPGLMEGAGKSPMRLTVDGAERRIEPELGRRAAGILKRHPVLRRVSWLADVRFGEGDDQGLREEIA
jgi:cytosine/adenosine deaminase-related metal-dependent hydrolase